MFFVTVFLSTYDFKFRNRRILAFVLFRVMNEILSVIFVFLRINVLLICLGRHKLFGANLTIYF